MKAGLRAFKHRNYRLFFGGQAISLVGTWMQQVAQGWLVLQLTNDPLWLGLVAVAQFGPVIVFGLFGGLIADHLPKRQTLMVTQAISMALAFALYGLTATGLVEVWHVMVLAALLGITNAVDMPTRQAFAVDMVGRDDMPNAVGLNAALFNASRIVGPAVAGVLIGLFDISIAFLINGISYIPVLIGYSLMRDSELRPIAPIARPTGWRDVVENLAEGASYVRRTPLVLLGSAVVGLAATFGMNFQVLVPPLADNVLDVGALGFGLLMAASGVGSTLAALSVAFSKKVGPSRIVYGAILLGAASVVLAVSTSFALSLVAMFFAGMGAIAMAVTANTTIQAAVPDQLRGRVMSVYTTVFAGSVPAGGLFAGFIASSWGVPAAFMAGAVLTLAVGVTSLVWLRRIQAGERRQLRERARAQGAGPAGPGEPSVRPEVAVGAAGDPALPLARRQ